MSVGRATGVDKQTDRHTELPITVQPGPVARAGENCAINSLHPDKIKCEDKSVKAKRRRFVSVI